MRKFIALFASLALSSAALAGGTVNHDSASSGSWVQMYLNQSMPLYAHLGECIVYASHQHQVPLELIIAVIKVEDGARARINPSARDTIDYGIMQINTVRMPEIEHYGVTTEILSENDCLNVFMGTYLLSNELKKAPEFWQGVGNYHYNVSGKYPHHHFAYISRVYRAWQSLSG